MFITSRSITAQIKPNTVHENTSSTTSHRFIKYIVITIVMIHDHTVRNGSNIESQKVTDYTFLYCGHNLC